MNSFGRALKLALAHRVNVVGCILTAIVVAVLWGGNLTAVFPVVDVIMNRAQGAMTAKAAMEVLGVLPGRHVRLPLVPAGDDLVAEIRSVLDAAGLLEDPTRK